MLYEVITLGTACYVKGAGDIYDKLKAALNLNDGDCTEDGLFSVEACRCIGACGLAPVIMVNDDVFGRLTVDDIDGIIKQYKDKEIEQAMRDISLHLMDT